MKRKRKRKKKSYIYSDFPIQDDCISVQGENTVLFFLMRNFKRNPSSLYKYIMTYQLLKEVYNKLESVEEVNKLFSNLVHLFSEKIKEEKDSSFNVCSQISSSIIKLKVCFIKKTRRKKLLLFTDSRGKAILKSRINPDKSRKNFIIFPLKELYRNRPANGTGYQQEKKSLWLVLFRATRYPLGRGSGSGDAPERRPLSSYALRIF